MEIKDFNQFKKIINTTFKQVVKNSSELKNLKQEMEKEPKQIYTKKELAIYCSKSEKTIDRWRTKGLKCMQKGRNGSVFFKISELEKFLNKR